MWHTLQLLANYAPYNGQRPIPSETTITELCCQIYIDAGRADEGVKRIRAIAAIPPSPPPSRTPPVSALFTPKIQNVVV